MKTYITDIIPKIQRFSQKLDDLSKLTNQHWVSLGDISQSKCVYIFRPNNQLLISVDGIVEKGTWEYLGNQSLLLDMKNKSFLLKHGFFDETILALKLDSSDGYAFFINETKYYGELNSIEEILIFLENKYLIKIDNANVLETKESHLINEKGKYGFTVISEKEQFNKIAWWSFTEYLVEFNDGKQGKVFKSNSGKYYYIDILNGKKEYFEFEKVVFGLYLYLKH